MISSLLHRREVLRLGSLSLFSFFGSGSQNRSTVSAANRRSNSESQKNCIFIFLQGGPSHLDLWDPKPNAPSEVRGPFQQIATNVEGVYFGELLQESARIADRLAVVRSMTHDFNNHIAGTYIMQTGSTVQPNVDREAASGDFPGPGAVLNWLQRKQSSVPTSVSLPNWLSIPGPSNRMPGQYGGFLGSTYDPYLISGNPEKDDFKPLSLTLPNEITPNRFSARLSLLGQLDHAASQLENKLTHEHDRINEAAYEMLVDPRVREAVDLTRESPATRDRYGRNKPGQSLLLARRLIEAGVRFVSFNELNQIWDHHGAIERKLKERVPMVDRAFAALVEDLDQRGMLNETLVVKTGEFGRTPLINKDGGRDHWPQVYSSIMAGGGVRGGQVYGSSDSKGGQVQSNPTSPADFLATMWALLGVDSRQEIHDRLSRPMALTNGRIIDSLIA